MKKLLVFISFLILIFIACDDNENRNIPLLLEQQKKEQSKTKVIISIELKACAPYSIWEDGEFLYICDKSGDFWRIEKK